MRAFGGAVAALAVMACFCAVWGQEQPTAPAQAGSVVVLDTVSVWRTHSELAPPMLATGEQAKLGFAWMNYETPTVGAEWTAPEFDDRFWCRGPVTLMQKTALMKRACARGKFIVTDPGAVKDLKLSATYHGGIVVYVNGKEAGREHIEQGKSLADGAGGEARSLEGMAIPPGTLRKGVNVIAIEVIRGVYPAAGTPGVETGENVYNVNTCELDSARVTAGDGTGLKTNVSRPAGMQAWAGDVLATDMNLDYGDEAEAGVPVTIIGARNGMFSGKALVGSTRPIRGIKATMGDLTGPGGKIPGTAADFRYGVEWGREEVRTTTRLASCWPYVLYEGTQFNGLSPEAPTEAGVPAAKQAWYGRADRPRPETVKATAGAMAPVWVRVKVPKDAKGGTYTGSLKIEAEGEKTIEMPVELRVADWALPDVQDFRTWVDIIQSPDTLAKEYNVPLWSEKHWELIARSFRAIGETGSRIVYVPLLAHTNLGNEESMVKWVKKPDGKYDYDFGVMERYLDTAEKNMGKPKLVVFVAWEVYMLPKGSDTLENAHGLAFRTKDAAQRLGKAGVELGAGPSVTVVDATTQKTEVMGLPKYSDAAASGPLWKPLFAELHKRMARRGLDGSAMLGLIPDAWATKQDVEFLKEASGNMPWVMQYHGAIPAGKMFYDIAPVGYQAVVWDARFSDDGADAHGQGKGIIASLHGWNRDTLWAQYERWSRESNPCTRWATQAEVCITGNQRGPGRLGGEYWKVIKDAKGQRVGRIHELYPESNWGNLAIPDALLAPGADGAVATNQMEALREGVQECEAITAIERALVDDGMRARLGPDLAKRCEECLNARHMMLWLSLSNLQFYYANPGSPRAWETYCMAQAWRGGADVSGHYWLLGSGYQERNAQLYGLAGEVQKKLK